MASSLGGRGRESFLSSAVEVAVGMAGFAGIVAAIRHRDIATWSHADRLLLRMLLLAAAMAITFALLPAVLAEAGLPAPTIWRTGSLSLMLWQIAIAARRSLQFRARRLALPFPRLLYAWVAGIISVQTLNLFLGASWPYLLGIFGILGNAFAFFLVLLLGPVEPGDAAA